MPSFRRAVRKNSGMKAAPPFRLRVSHPLASRMPINCSAIRPLASTCIPPAEFGNAVNLNRNSIQETNQGGPIFRYQLAATRDRQPGLTLYGSVAGHQFRRRRRGEGSKDRKRSHEKADKISQGHSSLLDGSERATGLGNSEVSVWLYHRLNAAPAPVNPTRH